MTEREKFEKWCKANKYTALYFRDDMYFDKATQMAWEAWQAAKATLFILPDRMDYELHGDKVINSHHNTWSDGYNQCLSDVISMNEEYSESAVLQWIPVSERLPEYGEPVLMLIPTSINYVVAGFISCDEQEDEEGPFHTCSLCDQYGDDIGYSIECLSHWMPLPTAPVKDGE